MLDASVVLKWFVTEEGPHIAEARVLRADHESGRTMVTVPSILYLEILNVAGRSWGWDRDALVELTGGLLALRFDTVDPQLISVAHWVAQGLTAYGAAYVAIAEELGAPLVSDDRVILEAAPEVARPL